MSPLEIFFDPIETPGIMTSKFWINSGSRSDPYKKKGAHQLLASVLTRGCGPYSNFELANLVEGVGANLRCEANEDGLLISLKCMQRDAYTLLPVVGWMIEDSHLSEDQISLEKDLSLQSLRRQKENPFHQAYDGWRKLAYGNGPYGHDPLGLIKDIEKLQRKDLMLISEKINFEKKILSIGGMFPEDLKKDIYELAPFKELSNQTNTSSLRPTSINWQDNNPKMSNNTALYPEETEQVVMMLGQQTIPHAHNDDLTLRLLGVHLGAGMSSYLFKLLRETHGVAYDLGVHHPIREGNAPFLLHASTSEEKATTTLKLLHKTWIKISRDCISEQELELAKAKFNSQILHNSQTASQITERKTHLRVLGLNENHDEANIDKIHSICTKDLQKTAKSHLKEPLLSLCGPEKAIERLSKLWEDLLSSTKD